MEQELTGHREFSSALRAQAKRDNDENISDRLCEQIKNSVIFEHNWEALLQSAPVAISATGACYAACFSDAGKRVTLDLPPSGSFKYLEHRALSANLLACGDRGRFAFMQAEAGLGFVKDISARAENKIVDIIDCISDDDPRTPHRLLMRHMAQLKNMADDCYSKVSAIDVKMEDWLHYTEELHRACSEKDATVMQGIRDKTDEQKVFENEKASQEDTLQAAKECSERFAKDMDTATAAFKQASDDFPSGWDIMGQQIVSSIAECALGSVNTFVQTVSNPQRNLTQITASLGDLFHGRKPDNKMPGSWSDDLESTANEQTNGTAKASAKQPAPDYSGDPAYNLVKRCLPFLDTLNGILHNGSEGGVDWDGADGDGKASSDTSINFVSLTLGRLLKDCSGKNARDPPSRQLFDILKTSKSIADAVKTEAKKGRNMGAKHPSPTSTVVKDWQKKFADQYALAAEMHAIAATLPGSTTGMPLMAAQVDCEKFIAQTNAKSVLAQTTMEAAKNRLSTTQSVFQTSQANYSQASQDLLEQQKKMTEIQSNLLKLTQDNMGLQEAKNVLEKCMALIIKVKASIQNLCRFFKSMSYTLEAIVNHSVQPFLEGLGDVAESRRIGEYSLPDLQRTMIFQAAVTIKAHFSVFGDIAAMWCQLSQQYIMPGVEMLDQLTLEQANEAERQNRIRKLLQWAMESSAGVQQIAQKSQREILDGMQSRVEEIQAVTKQLPPSAPVKKALEAGMQSSQAVAAATIKSAPGPQALKRFGMKKKAV